MYCELIELATHATYGYEDVNTAAWIRFPGTAKAQVLASVKSMKLAKDLGPTESIVEIPRYQDFTTDALTLVHNGVCFSQIAGNELIVISVLTPSSWAADDSHLQLLLRQPILTAPRRMRAVLLARVFDLCGLLPSLERQGLEIEHLYDF